MHQASRTYGDYGLGMLHVQHSHTSALAVTVLKFTVAYCFQKRTQELQNDPRRCLVLSPQKIWKGRPSMPSLRPPSCLLPSVSSRTGDGLIPFFAHMILVPLFSRSGVHSPIMINLLLQCAHRFRVIQMSVRRIILEP
ncbi:hypothetical protein LENED_011340 [Lentinula edodes]|uniref:Uncharacterized protein n=1 Tax=Lentinula edodes TaxID=5353 RepID=A0A1Q3EPU4_LENED|nr:hypothetical protein LENED_011340 [Lentinula edodes]